MVPGGFRGWTDHGTEIEDRSGYWPADPDEQHVAGGTRTSRRVLLDNVGANSIGLVRIPVFQYEATRRSHAPGDLAKDLLGDRSVAGKGDLPAARYEALV